MKKFVASLFCLLIVLCLQGCQSENKYVRIAVKENVDGMNLYLTGKATGKFGVSNYVYIDGSANYVENVLDKLSKSYAGCDIAYFEVADLEKVFDSNIKDELKIVCIDAYNQDGSIKSVWVARKSYIEKCPKYFPKVVKGLIASSNYRANNCSLNESYATLKARILKAGKNEDSWLYKVVDFTDYNFDDFTNVYEYCAIYSFQNAVNENFDVTSAVFKSNDFAYESYCDVDLTKNELLQAVYEKCYTSKSFEEVFELEAMVKAITEVKNEKPSSSSQNTLQAILWGVGLFVVVGTVVIIIVRKNKKEGKNLFDIKAALDADIEKKIE